MDLVTFWCSAANVRMELSLDSQHDLGGSGGSENRRFSDIFRRLFVRCILRVFFQIFNDFGLHFGLLGASFWVPLASQIEEIRAPLCIPGPGAPPGSHLGVFGLTF